MAGEAGVGKTSLVRAFCAELALDVRVLRGGCDALFTPRPLGPFLELAADANGEFRAASASGAAPHALVDALRRGRRTRANRRRPRGYPLGRRGEPRCAPLARPEGRTLDASRARDLPRRPRPDAPAPDRARRARDAADGVPDRARAALGAGGCRARGGGGRRRRRAPPQHRRQPLFRHRGAAPPGMVRSPRRSGMPSLPASPR